MVDCFVAYLAGHNRPVHEVLFSNDLPLNEIFDSDFVGMTAAEIPLQRLIETRQHIRQELPKVLTDVHRCFLLSFVRAEPDWSLMPFGYLKDMPAINWKLLNLKKLRTSAQRKCPPDCPAGMRCSNACGTRGSVAIVPWDIESTPPRKNFVEVRKS